MILRKEQISATHKSRQQETIARWVQIVNLATSCYNVGTIWMAQFGYRLWAHVKPGEFAEYHKAWWEGWGGIQPIVFPSGTAATLGSLAQLRWRSARVPRWLIWLNIIVLVLAWLLTGVLWAPLQARLQQTRREDGTLDKDYQWLMRSHWLRVALFTGSGIVQFCMSLLSFLSRD